MADNELSKLFKDRLAQQKQSRLEDIFEEIPVDLKTFVEDKKFLGNFPLSPVQFDTVKHIERVYYNGWTRQNGRDVYDKNKDTYAALAEHERYWRDPVRMTNLITVQWGKGAGKDATVRVATARVVYLLLCLKNPQEYFGIQPQDSIHLLNVATNAGQALAAFYKPFTRMMKTGWFKDKAQPTQNAISFIKNVESQSGHSEAESQEGLNLLLGIADEIDAFPSLAERKINASGRMPTNTAEGIMEMMRTSGSTRFSTYKTVAISYPRFLGSTIQTLTAEAKEDNEKYGEQSNYYVSGPLPTWDVNPRVPGPPNLSRDMEKDYEKNPEMAASKYECKPSRAIAPFFRNTVALDSMWYVPDQQPLQVVQDAYDPVYNKDNEVISWNPRYEFAPDFVPIQGAIYAMHADMAKTGDRAGIAMSHVVRQQECVFETMDEYETVHEVREMRPVVKTDFVIYYESSIETKPSREIQIRWARELFFKLRLLGFNIQSFTFDGWQSLDSMQLLQLQGIESERVTTDLNDFIWKNLEDLMHEGRIMAPRIELLRNELMGLHRNSKGKIDHPTGEGGSKDLADAFACSVVGAIKLGGQEDPKGAVAHYTDHQFTVAGQMDRPVAFEDVNINFGERAYSDFHPFNTGQIFW